MVPNGKLRILIVEDQPMVADALKLLLKIEGYEVQTAENWREAMALFQPGKFAVVFTDYNMPERNGHELASLIRAQESRQPIILVTGYSDLARAYASADVDRVLEKPWTVEDIRAAINDALKA